MDSLTSRGLAPAILLLLATTGIADAQQLAYAPVGDGLGVPAVAAINQAAGNPLPGAALREEREAEANIARYEARQICPVVGTVRVKAQRDPKCLAAKAEAEKVRKDIANRPDPMLRPKSEVFSAMSVAGTAVPESVNPDNARLAWEAEKPLAADGFNAPIPKYHIASLGTDIPPPPARKPEAVAAITPPPRATVQATVAEPAYQPRSAKVAQATTTAPAATVTDAPSPGFMTTVLPFFQVGLGVTATTADNNGDGALLAGASVGVATPINSRLGMVFRLDGDVSYGPRSWDYNDYKGQKSFDFNEDGHLRYGGNLLGGFAFNGGDGFTPYLLGGWRFEGGKGGSANGATVVAGAELWKFVTLEYRYTHLDRVIFYGGTRDEHALMLKYSIGLNGWAR